MCLQGSLIVTLQFLKYPTAPHWRLDTFRLGDDEYGVWLGVPAGGVMQKGSEPPIETPRPFVVLVPENEWWTVVHTSPGSDAELYVDIAAPATWESPDRVTIVDLDLDVVRWADGRVELVDEDEFIEHQTALGYPAWMTDHARAAAAQAVLYAESRIEPFGSAGKVWLERIS